MLISKITPKVFNGKKLYTSTLYFEQINTGKYKVYFYNNNEKGITAYEKHFTDFYTAEKYYHKMRDKFADFLNY